jgi:hypothetical protein
MKTVSTVMVFALLGALVTVTGAIALSHECEPPPAPPNPNPCVIEHCERQAFYCMGHRTTRVPYDDPRIGPSDSTGVVR